ncbi:MAG: peptide chain release factor N(5)-glutamine methyltransferase [Chloroflexi bacterium]|nr:peptide chain release factor N(5)-glutamine methyltransferase [Chloroflexota bacterium]
MKNKISIANWLAQARMALSAHLPGETSSSSLYAILEKHSRHPREWLIANQDVDLDEKILPFLEQDLSSLFRGKPLAYILGEWDFYGLQFEVNSDVLIPRPETELLVENALAYLASKSGGNLAVDVGCGSGCIAIAITRHAPSVKFLAADISHPALQVTQRNIRKFDLEDRIFPVQSDLLSGIPTKFDLICANLPYIPHAELQELAVSQFEPGLALDGGKDGLYSIRNLLMLAPACLKAGGCMLLEMQYDQGKALQELASLHFPQARVIIKRDLAQQERLMIIQL